MAYDSLFSERDRYVHDDPFARRESRPDADTTQFLRDVENVRLRAVGSVSARLYTVNRKDLEMLMSRRLYDRAKQIVYRVGQQARDRARAAAPRDSGALAASIYVTNPGSRPENINQRTQSYWRAIHAAAGRNPRGLSIGTAPELMSSIRAQTRRNSLSVGNMVTGKNIYQRLTGGREGVFTVGQLASHIGGTDANEPNEYSFMPIQAAGQDSFYVAMGAAAYYAGYVEFGTWKMAPRPFFVPAVNWAQREAVRQLRGLIENGV